MKNAKRDSGISYSSIAILLMSMALAYGFYQKISNTRTEVSVAYVIEPQDDSGLGLASEHESEQKPLPSAAAMAEDLVPVAGIAPEEKGPVQAKTLKSWRLEDFKNLMQRTQSELPLLADFKNLSPKEVHHTPEILNRAGTKLGLIAEILALNPDFGPIAQEFYQDCLVRKDLPTSIRALCLANHRNLRVLQGYSLDWQEEEIRTTTSEIRELAEHVPLK